MHCITISSSNASQVEDVFSKVSTWRHHGKDYEHLSLQLELAHLAYQRWSQTVKLVDSDTPTGPLNLPTASESEAKTVKKLLGAIASAFQDIEQTSQRYETGVGANDTPMETDEKKSPLDALMAKVRAANKARQAGTGVVQKAIWVVHDKSAFETLVGRVCLLLKSDKCLDNRSFQLMRCIGVQKRRVSGELVPRGPSTHPGATCGPGD